jgi:hypothetical protein
VKCYDSIVYVVGLPSNSVDDLAWLNPYYHLPLHWDSSRGDSNGETCGTVISRIRRKREDLSGQKLSTTSISRDSEHLFYSCCRVQRLAPVARSYENRLHTSSGAYFAISCAHMHEHVSKRGVLSYATRYRRLPAPRGASFASHLTSPMFRNRNSFIRYSTAPRREGIVGHHSGSLSVRALYLVTGFCDRTARRGTARDEACLRKLRNDSKVRVLAA